MANPDYPTAIEIRKRLVGRRANRKLSVFHAEVERLTGMKVSKSHLANILSGEKQPNDIVMRYLGGTVEKRVVYQIGSSNSRKRKAKQS
jgi:transcriptional regulator with XRE-family HTH domain